MGTRFCSTIVMATLAVPVGFSADRQPERVLKIKIRFYDYAQLPKATLGRAQRQVVWILRKAGLESTWHQCAAPAAERESDSECEKRWTPTDLVLRILPRKMARGLSTERDVYGWAASSNNGDFAFLADVFYHRIEELAKRRGAPCSLLLGHFLAHEIGHLLLGPDSHSRSGIMHVPLDETQLKRALLGALLFTPSEAERMRSEVRKRREVSLSQDPDGRR
jgi:hypothetical protein